MIKNKIGNWTGSFSEFRAKVEPLFGNLELLAEQAPDVYAHMVLAHGFMEYFGVRSIHNDIQERIRTEKGSYNRYDNPEHCQLYLAYEKEEYLKWARDNNLPEHLLELGWETYCND